MVTEVCTEGGIIRLARRPPALVEARGRHQCGLGRASVARLHLHVRDTKVLKSQNEASMRYWVGGQRGCRGGENGRRKAPLAQREKGGGVHWARTREGFAHTESVARWSRDGRKAYYCWLTGPTVFHWFLNETRNSGLPGNNHSGRNHVLLRNEHPNYRFRIVSIFSQEMMSTVVVVRPLSHRRGRHIYASTHLTPITYPPTNSPYPTQPPAYLLTHLPAM